MGFLLFSYDEGDPDKYKTAMQAAVKTAFGAVATALGFIPVVGAALAAVAGPLLAAVAPDVGEALNDALDTGDDQLGNALIALTGRQMVVLAARTQNSGEKNIGYKFATPLLTGGGASYKVYFETVPA